MPRRTVLAQFQQPIQNHCLGGLKQCSVLSFGKEGVLVRQISPSLSGHLIICPFNDGFSATASLVMRHSFLISYQTPSNSRQCSYSLPSSSIYHAPFLFHHAPLILLLPHSHPAPNPGHPPTPGLMRGEEVHRGASPLQLRRHAGPRQQRRGRHLGRDLHVEVRLAGGAVRVVSVETGDELGEAHAWGGDNT